MDERDRRIAELESLLHAIRHELLVRGRLPAPVAEKALRQIDAALRSGPSPAAALLLGAKGAADGGDGRH
jgi:hypothetical protein